MMAEAIPVKIIIAVDRPAPLLSMTLPVSVKVDSSGNIFNKLGKRKNHIFILDKCKRLNYEVVPPWTVLITPYVSATILATHYSNPCGLCYFGPSTTPVESLQKNAETTTTASVTTASQQNVLRTQQNEENKQEIEEVKRKLAFEVRRDELEKTMAGFEKFVQHLENTNTLGVTIEKDNNSSEFSNNPNGTVKSEKNDKAKIVKDTTELERLKDHYESLIPWIWREMQDDNFQ